MIDMKTAYRVTASGLNLRTKPKVRPDTRIAVLSNGHEVELVGSAEAEGWVMVTTVVDGKEVTGFVARRFLSPSEDFDEPESVDAVSEVHIRDDHPNARRDHDGQRVHPLSEQDRPTRDLSASWQARRDSLIEIVEWLDAERSARYRARTRETWCNIYAYDYCYLANVYLPRVWWKPGAIARLQQGEAVRPHYTNTIDEMRANHLFDWLRDWGARFGWERFFDLTELQDHANGGGVGVIVGQHNQFSASGHISVVVPEVDDHVAIRRDGEVRRPLQSQAGRTNFNFGTPHWWTQSHFRDFAFWAAP